MQIKEKETQSFIKDDPEKSFDDDSKKNQKILINLQWDSSHFLWATNFQIGYLSNKSRTRDMSRSPQKKLTCLLFYCTCMASVCVFLNHTIETWMQFSNVMNVFLIKWRVFVYFCAGSNENILRWVVVNGALLGHLKYFLGSLT